MAFYQCSKCKNKWQHNVSKCPDCFSDLKRMKSAKAKVVGVSKTTIPSILHPRTPYFILLLEDEHGNRWAHKSAKEYRMNDDFVVKPDKKAVGVWRIKYDPLEAVEKTIELTGDVSIDRKSKILVLPTLESAVHPYIGDNTSPEFLEAAIEFLMEQGAEAGNIKVGAQSFDEVSVEACAKKSQLLDACLKYGITPLDLGKTGFIEKNSLKVSREIEASDLIVNLPIMKLNKESFIRGASDNLLKLLDRDTALSGHPGDLIRKIPDVLPEHVSIAEAVSVQRSDRYLNYLGIVLSARNPLHLDRVFSEIVMSRGLPEHLKDIKIEHIPVAGRQIEELQLDIDRLCSTFN